MNNEKEILQDISDIISVSNELNIKAYIWGGYVQDIMEGKILREHGDIDMFIENMDKNVNELIKKLKTKDFICSYYGDMQMLILNKNNIKATLNPIIFRNATAIWKHIGDQGFFSFPKEWLDTEYKEFQGINVLTAGYKF
jgi:hypothetical protein